MNGRSQLYDLAFKHKIGWYNSHIYVTRLASHYFNESFDLQMSEKVLRDGIKFYLCEFETNQESCYQNAIEILQ